MAFITFSAKFYSIRSLLLIAAVVASLLVYRYAHASPLSVCSSGCDFTTITGAFADPGLTTADTITIGATYDPTGETYPLDFPLSVDTITLDCQQNGATIGKTTQGQGMINFYIGSTIKDCTLSNVDLTVQYNNATITDNIFDTTKPTTISFSAASDFSVTGNTNINRIVVDGGGSGTIEDNTIATYTAIDNGFGINILNSATNVAITNNTISNHAVWVPTVISSIHTESVGPTDATVVWFTNFIASTNIEYGLTSGYGSTSGETDTSPRVTSHTVVLSGLAPCTTYHYKAIATDASLLTIEGEDQTFTTTGCGGVPEITFVTTLSPSETSATVQWNTDIDASTQLVYGLTNTYGSIGTETDISPRVTSHSVTIGTSACTTYHFKVVSIDDFLNTNESGDFSFFTGCGGPAGNLALVAVDTATDIVFTGNTIDSPVVPQCDHCGTIQVGRGTNISFEKNYITLPSQSDADHRVLRYQPGNTDSVSGTVEHNTFSCLADSSSCVIMELFGGTDPGESVDITANYNLFYNFAASPAGQGIRISTGGSVVTMPNDYNGFWNLNTNIDDGGTGVTLGAHHATLNPVFQLNDADASNDLHLAPFSPYLDVNGGQDIGAFGDTVTSPNTTVRRTTMYVDAAGTIDYASVDATDTADTSILHSIRNGDRIQLAAGTYSPFTVINILDLFPDNTVTDATSDITITGAGTDTIINVPGATDGIIVQDLDTVSIDHLLVHNATTTSTLYQATKALWEYAGNTYDDSGDVGGPPDAAFYIKSGSGCDVGSIVTDGTDISAAIGGAADDWNVGLFDVLGFKITVYTPDRFASTSGDLSTYLLTNCGTVNTVDQYIPSIFTANGDGTYSFNAAAAATALAAIKSGETDPPHIDRIINGFAGIKLVNVNTSTLENVTSTNNSIGIWFSGNSSNNSILESDLSGNTLHDIKSDSSGDNDLKNDTFDRTTTSITGTGEMNVWFKARAQVTDQSSAPIVGATVDFTDGNNIATATVGPTDGSGDSPYTDNLLAYSMTENAIAETSAGYNPYTITATKNNLTHSINENLNTPNQSFDITLTASPSPTPLPPRRSSLRGAGNILPIIVPSSVPTGAACKIGERFNPISGLPCAPLFPDTGHACGIYMSTYIKFGATNDPSEVRKLQTFLTEKEGEKISITGTYDHATYDAVKRFQAKYLDAILIPQGIHTPTGYVGVWTQKKINEINCPIETTKKVPAPQTCSVFSTLLKRGSKGTAVRDVQEFLIAQATGPRAVALARNGITEYFGALTEKAVEEFQTAYSKDILVPQGFAKPTGWWYANTIKKANTLGGCNPEVRL